MRGYTDKTKTEFAVEVSTDSGFLMAYKNDSLEQGEKL